MYFIGLQLSLSPAPLNDIITGVLSLLALAIPVAAFGFFLNEWTDIAEDTAAGKPNNAVLLQPFFRTLLLVIISIVLSVVLWGYSYPNIVRWLVLAQILAFILYSCHPFRLKNSPVAAVLLDAIYSGTLFYIIALQLSIGSFIWKYAMLITAFGLFKGLRNIIFHLVTDKKFDTMAGKETMAHIISEQQANKTQEALWLIESTFLIVLSYYTTSTTFIIVLLGFIIILIKRHFYADDFHGNSHNKLQWLGELNTLYELWLPLAAITGVMWQKGIIHLIISWALLLFVFPYTRKVFHELYIALYNAYYFVSDLYFVYTKPYFDIGKIFRRIFRR